MVDCLTLLVPPYDQLENGALISINRISVTASLNRFSFPFQPQQIGLECFG
jgi:hypothetical protein